MKILVVDDERAARRSLHRVVSQFPGVELTEAASLEEATALLETQRFDAALLDLRLGSDPENRDGLALVKAACDKSVLPIVVSGFHDMSGVRAAMRLGAYDYILKDELSEELVLPILESIRNQRRLEGEVILLRSRRGAAVPAGLLGTSSAMQRLRDMIQRVAVSDRPVLVTGPTGAGKEVAVRAIHAMGPHPDEPLLDLNCGALPVTLIESQLFGHERGAFTGAHQKHDGFFAAVRRGTLFLDEIGELPLELQAKLLRVLETGAFRPLGATATRAFEGRIVAATHVDLEARVAAGSFREDLYYRLNVLEIRVPSLDERREDIPALVAHFVATQTRPLLFAEDAMARLQSMRWRGNVRQLRNLIDRLAVFAPDGPITSEVLGRFLSPEHAVGSDSALTELVREVLRRDDADKLALVESALVEEALRLSSGNRTAAARLLGVHRKVVERRLDRPPSVGGEGGRGTAAGG